MFQWAQESIPVAAVPIQPAYGGAPPTEEWSAAPTGDWTAPPTAPAAAPVPVPGAPAPAAPTTTTTGEWGGPVQENWA